MADLAEVQIKENEKAEPASQAPGRSLYFRQRPRTPQILVGAAIVLTMVGVAVRHYLAGRESTDDAQIDGHITPVSARVGGTVVAVNVNDNQFVEVGAVLAQIDPADYQIALQRAQADLQDEQAAASAARTNVPIEFAATSSGLETAHAKEGAAAAGLEAAQKAVDAARAQLNSSHARQREAEANFNKASKDLERMKQLIGKDEISQQQYDAAVAAAEAASATVDSAKAAVAGAQQGIQVAESHVAEGRAVLVQAQAEVKAAKMAPEQVAVTRAHAGSAEAKVQQMRAALDLANLHLQYATVKAPISGVVSKKTVEVGEVVQPGQPLLAIVPLQDIWVTANFKETQLKSMRAGQRAIISVDTYGGRKYQGHVESIAAATGEKFSLLPPENATGNYVKVVQRVPVKILFERGQDPEHLLRPGMSVSPTVITRP